MRPLARRTASRSWSGHATGWCLEVCRCQDRGRLCLQVVLLGDHKQLRPVVRSEQLQNLGLDRSLFERYHADACLLDTQYRMVSRSQPRRLWPRCGMRPGMPKGLLPTPRPPVSTLASKTPSSLAPCLAARGHLRLPLHGVLQEEAEDLAGPEAAAQRPGPRWQGELLCPLWPCAGP